MTCDALAFADTPGCCDLCGTRLTGRQKRWCSSACSIAYTRMHDWNMARTAARKRDGERCVTCGARGGYWDGSFSDWHAGGAKPVWVPQLEVNHIAPREGRGYGFGCWNHPENLETLCHPCHVAVTRQQAADRKARA